VLDQKTEWKYRALVWNSMFEEIIKILINGMYNQGTSKQEKKLFGGTKIVFGA
jgi:chemotaxis receptor (MCP) glutamine deamidase CheD